MGPGARLAIAESAPYEWHRLPGGDRNAGNRPARRGASTIESSADCPPRQAGGRNRRFDDVPARLCKHCGRNRLAPRRGRFPFFPKAVLSANSCPQP
ncbi:hypothetical protein DSCA_24540 [Desulfosarcina alkanivorans]|uniref:Uncharacterized protein n=1 Tax=Desulfosarcina alkanivorans TaxID=571177 RepID=A0A5K7YQD6_9BACT|nr:hypothetical protein DSCA_24540 [Desulfosarcina alkanivorans]